MVTNTLDVVGGNLVFPKYRVSLSVEENRLFMFAGGKNVHGVSPIRARNKNAYRYSVVWYPLKQMCNCLPFGEELQRARGREVEKSRLTREERSRRLKGGRR